MDANATERTFDDAFINKYNLDSDFHTSHFLWHYWKSLMGKTLLKKSADLASSLEAICRSCCTSSPKL